MKITLIGSTKFKSRFLDANERLTAASHVVYTVAFHGHADNRELTADVKETLDLVHLRKIMESDAVVLITNVNRYVGESTRRELRWAAILGKEEFNWTDDHDRATLLFHYAPVPQDDLLIKPMDPATGFEIDVAKESSSRG